MNNLLNIKTPAEPQATALKSDYGLDNLGLTNFRQVYWNLPMEALYEEIIFRGEAKITQQGPLVASIGKHTGRSAGDKLFVREPESDPHVWWGQYNRPIAADKFAEIHSRVQGFFQGRDVFVQDCYVGADPEFRMPIRVITELAWHSMFVSSIR